MNPAKYRHCAEMEETMGRFPRWIYRGGTAVTLFVGLLIFALGRYVGYTERIAVPARIGFGPDSAVVVRLTVEEEVGKHLLPGAPVKLEIAEYPADEHGYVEGRIASVKTLPDERRSVSLSLPGGWRTTRGTEIARDPYLPATAHVPVREVTLWDKLKSGMGFGSGRTKPTP